MEKQCTVRQETDHSIAVNGTIRNTSFSQQQYVPLCERYMFKIFDALHCRQTFIFIGTTIPEPHNVHIPTFDCRCSCGSTKENSCLSILSVVVLLIAKNVLLLAPFTAVLLLCSTQLGTLKSLTSCWIKCTGTSFKVRIPTQEKSVFDLAKS